MGLFTNQISRLMRNRWPNAQLLAEELFAILSSDEPIVIDSPVQITASDGAPPLTLRNFGTSDTMIQTVRGTPDFPEFPELPALDIPDFTSDPGLLEITNYYGDGTSETFDTDRGDPEFDPDNLTRGQGQSRGGGGGGFPGTVVSGGPGTGPYRVNVFLDGPAGEPTELDVTQLDIEDDETIAPGTWTIVNSAVFEGETSYYMQVPVWGEDL